MLHCTKYCQEDAEIGKFSNLILPTASNCPWGENSCDTNICQLEFEKNSPVIKSWYTAWWIVFRRIHWFNYYTIYTFRMLKSELNDPINSHPKWLGSRNNDHTNLGAWFLACLSSSPVPNTMLVVPWSLYVLWLVLCSARGTRVWIWLLTEIWIHARAVTVTREYWYHLRQ